MNNNHIPDGLNNVIHNKQNNSSNIHKQHNLNNMN